MFSNFFSALPKANARAAVLLMVILAVLLVHEAPPAQAQGSSGAPFGVDGTVTTDFGSGHDLAHAVLVQPNGKILAAGYSHNGSNHDFALARYNVDGSLDTGFGTDGKVTTAIGSDDDYGKAVALQPDGKIVVAGESDLDFALARYTAAGALDATFGNEGTVTIDFESGQDRADGVIVQSDGKIVAAGHSRKGSTFYRFAMVRYTTAGVLDTSFGTGGKVTTDLPPATRADYGFAMTEQSDGKILVAGRSYNGSNYDFALVRYTTDGALDTDFGDDADQDGTKDGWVTTPIGSGNDQVDAVAVQPDGKIVTAGHSHNGSNNDVALARYNANGSLDTGFGTGGKVITSLGSGRDEAHGVVVLSDGKIVVAGFGQYGSSYNIALVRYTATGALDTIFNTDGKVTTAISGFDSGYAMALQPDGKIVVAGASFTRPDIDFAFVRYTPDGELDSPSLMLPDGTITHWSDAFTVKAVDYGFGCGYRTGQPQCDDVLTNDVITYDGVDYEIELVHVAYGGTLEFILDKEPRDEDGSQTKLWRSALYVNDRRFNIADAMVSGGIADGGVWTNEGAWGLAWVSVGLEWSENQRVLLILATPPVGGL